MKTAYQFLLYHYYLFISSACFIFISHSTNSSCHPHQSSILLQLEREFSPLVPEYSKMRDWKEGSDCCLWDGVSCNMETGYVVGLDLSSSLAGPLRSNSSLFRLLHLRKLNLAGNNFSSCSIPSEFGQLSRLTHLDLSYSDYSGRIPSEISSLTNLISLDLSYFSGVYFSFDTYPTKQDPELLRRLSQNLTSLEQLHLSGLNLSSQVPESLANLSSLTHLSLDRCGLIGEFPKRIFQLPNIQVIDLSNNEDLTGSLPEFHSGSNLTSLRLENAKFVGKIPNSIGNLKSLDALVLSYCMFSGPVPYFIGNLSQLSYLSLSGNFFNGQLPSTLGNLAKIQQLHLRGNEFSGEFPSSLGNLPQLAYLNLRQNNFRSHVPSSLANLTQLDSLDLSDNFFHGRVPISFPYLLEKINFRNNSLTGSIPSHSFNNLTFLIYLDLSSNSLNGAIPSSLLTLPFLRELYLDDNQFIGLEILSNSSFLESLSLRGNRLNGHIPSSISKFILLRNLQLSSNNLSGRVDFKIFSRMLKTLDLSYNSLSLTTNISMNISALPMFKDLFLSSCNITEFPVFLKAQNELDRLDLSNNRIGGLIPNWFLSMNLGWLSLSHNFLTGWEEVPLIHQWKSLVHLNLNSNMLQGPLVVPPMSTMFLFISNNSLTGRIDPLFCKLRDLEVLDASNNHLDGTIPQCLKHLDGSLRVLNLRRNNFHGNIPQICRDRSTLMTLDLSHNQLYGNIPRSLVKFKNLDVLNLGHNQLSDTFPFWLQDLQRLQVLVLSSNKFHGPIWCPHDFFGFMTLKTIDLSHNDFTGNLPLEYFRNWTSMSYKVSKMGFESGAAYNEKGTYNDSVKIIFKGQEMEVVKTLTVFISIDLSNNKFDGEIPSTLWHLRSLVMLNLSSNNFDGLIPSSIGNLKELESLDLSNNKLFGKIPQQLIALTFLAYLNLSHNQLVGQIPQGGQVSTFQDSSFEGNMGLCGIPLSRRCEAPLPASNDDYNNEKSDSIFGFGWKAVVVGYGCGLLIGMVAGHVITSRRPGLMYKVFRVRLQR